MTAFRPSRVASAMLLVLALASVSGCGSTTSTPTGEVRVINGGTLNLATIRIVHGGGQSSINNIGAGGIATFPHVAHGTFTATGYNGSNQVVVSQSGTLSGTTVTVTLDW